MHSNDTFVDTPFQLISGFFHVNQGVLCSEHTEQASCRGVLEGGGGNRLAKLRWGSNRLPGLVTKSQAVEFPQVLTSSYKCDSYMYEPVYKVQKLKHMQTDEIFLYHVHNAEQSLK